MLKAKSILWVWFALLLAACVPPGPPPVSPLIPNQVPVMLDNQWRLTDLVYNGMHHNFDLIEPVLVQFSPGSLLYRACNSGGMYFDTENIQNPNEYRLLPGAATANDCPGGGTEQGSIFLQALSSTNHYEIEGDTLVLSGENARLTFVIDNEAKKPDYITPPESPLIPNQVPAMLDNQWRLTGVMYNGTQREFDSIEPVLIAFEPGRLSIQACNDIRLYLDTTGIEDPNGYQFWFYRPVTAWYRFWENAFNTARDCSERETAQEAIFLDALTSTNHYEIEGDTLVLSGENARLTFVIDNEAKKPSD